MVPAFCIILRRTAYPQPQQELPPNTATASGVFLCSFEISKRFEISFDFSNEFEKTNTFTRLLLAYYTHEKRLTEIVIDSTDGLVETLAVMRQQLPVTPDERISFGQACFAPFVQVFICSGVVKMLCSFSFDLNFAIPPHRQHCGMKP